MQSNTYLIFNGNCEAAFKYYEQCFGGKITMLSTYGASPAAAHVPAEIHHCIIHARLEAGGQVFMGSDSPPSEFKPPQGFYVCLAYDNVVEAERVFKTLADGGNVTMAFAPTFFAAGYGSLVDQFGVPWMIICEKAD